MPHKICPTRKLLRTVVLYSALVFLIFLLAWVIAPTFDVDKRQRLNQVEAYVSVKDLSMALGVFKHRRGGYPGQLGPVHDVFVDMFVANHKYLDRDSAERTWQHIESHTLGYSYDYVPSQEVATSNGSLSAHYEIRADPVERGKTGFKSFYASDRSTIRSTGRRRAGPDDPAIE